MSKLFLIFCSILFLGSCDLEEVALPVVNMGIPQEDATGRLQVQLRGEYDIRGMNPDVIVSTGFAWSDTTFSPLPNRDASVEFLRDDLQFDTLLQHESFSYDVNQYFVRAFVHLVDEYRDDYIFSETFDFSFNSKFNLSLGFLELFRDTIVADATVIFQNDTLRNSIQAKGHLISDAPNATLETCPDCFTSLGPGLEDNQYRTKTAVSYNTGILYVRAVVALEDDTIYSPESSVRVTGGMNPSTNYPGPLTAGVSASVGEWASDTFAYVGIGDALYLVKQLQGTAHEIKYTEIDLPSSLQGMDMEFGTAFFVGDQFCYAFGRNTQTNDLFPSMVCYSDSAWLPPIDLLNTISMPPRTEAVSWVIQDTAYIGFGTLASATQAKDILEYVPSRTSAPFRRFLAPDQVPAQNGMCAATIGNTAYLVSGNQQGPDVESLTLYKFTPNGASGIWEVLPSKVVASRQNATAMALNDKLYVGLGSNVGTIEVRSDFWVYDPEGDGNKWSQLNTTFDGDPRDHAVSFTLNGRGYFGSGSGIINQATPDMWVLTPNLLD